MKNYYCPLVKFNLSANLELTNDVFNISNDLIIMSKKKIPDLSILSDHLTDTEISLYKAQVQYWLYLKTDFSEVEVMINIFQLSLWMIKPTRFYISFFTNLAKEKTELKLRNFFSKSNYIPKYIMYEFDNDDIEKLKKYFPIMMGLYKKKKFKNSLVFNYHGCVASYWEAAYILFTTTFESLLSEGSRYGIKKKLALAYAILTEDESEGRQKAFVDFKRIYKIRSEILHGESFKDKYNDGNLNLEELAKCRDMLRKLWQVILDSKETIEKLKLNDAKRRKYFKKVANGWIPKENNENKEQTPFCSPFPSSLRYAATSRRGIS